MYGRIFLIRRVKRRSAGLLGTFQLEPHAPEMGIVVHEIVLVSTLWKADQRIQLFAGAAVVALLVIASDVVGE